MVIRSALTALRMELVIGVRYFDRDVCGTGCCAIGVLPLAALIMLRGPGVIAEVKQETDLLRRRLFKLFNEPRTETFCLAPAPDSEPDVIRLISSVM